MPSPFNIATRWRAGPAVLLRPRRSRRHMFPKDIRPPTSTSRASAAPARYGSSTKPSASPTRSFSQVAGMPDGRNYFWISRRASKSAARSVMARPAAKPLPLDSACDLASRPSTRLLTWIRPLRARRRDTHTRLRLQSSRPQRLRAARSATLDWTGKGCSRMFTTPDVFTLLLYRP